MLSQVAPTATSSAAFFSLRAGFAGLHANHNNSGGRASIVTISSRSGRSNSRLIKIGLGVTRRTDQVKLIVILSILTEKGPTISTRPYFSSGMIGVIRAQPIKLRMICISLRSPQSAAFTGYQQQALSGQRPFVDSAGNSLRHPLNRSADRFASSASARAARSSRPDVARCRSSVIWRESSFGNIKTSIKSASVSQKMAKMRAVKASYHEAETIR